MAQQTDITPFIWLGIIGAAAYFAYENGWLALIGMCPSGETVVQDTFPTCVSATSSQATGTSTTVNSPVTTTVTTPTTPISTTPTSTPPASAVTPVQPIPSTGNLSVADQPWYDQMAELANTNSLDIDQWNYYFNQLATTTWAGTLSPINGTQMSAMLATLASLGQTRSTPMTLPQWYYLVTAGGGGLSGFTGFGNYSGIPIGAIHGGW